MSGVTKERLGRFFKRQGDLEVHMGELEGYVAQIDKHQIRMGTVMAKHLTEFHTELKLLHRHDMEVRSLPLVRFSLWLRDLKLWVQSFSGGQDEKDVDAADGADGDVVPAGAGTGGAAGDEGHSGSERTENREAATASGSADGSDGAVEGGDSAEPRPTGPGDSGDVEGLGRGEAGELGGGPPESEGETEEAPAT